MTMNKLLIQRLDPEVILPSYMHEDDAAFDLRASENKTVLPGKKETIGTGLKLAIPKNHVGLIWGRSGLAHKNEIAVLGGVIDSGFRGEVKVILKNHGEESFKISKNDRIAQMIVQPYSKSEILEVENLEETDRKGGLGHTGIK